MAASDQRLVGLELQLDVAALKTQVDALQTAVDAIDTVTAAWVLNGADGALPTAAVIKAELANYNALNAGLSKGAVSITDSIAVINAA